MTEEHAFLLNAVSKALKIIQCGVDVNDQNDILKPKKCIHKCGTSVAMQLSGMGLSKDEG